jgi:hypothetical protein
MVIWDGGLRLIQVNTGSRFRRIVKACIHTMQHCRTAAADGDVDQIKLSQVRSYTLAGRSHCQRQET